MTAAGIAKNSQGGHEIWLMKVVNKAKFGFSLITLK